MDEVWKSVEGYSKYKISNHGRMWKKSYTVSFYSNKWDKKVEKEYPSGYCRPTDQGRGYLQIGLRNSDGGQDRYLVHRLVMHHFGPEPPTVEHKWVNHIDGDKKNNRIDNLEWVTPALNQLHSAYLEAIEYTNKKKVDRRLQKWAKQVS